MDVILTNTIQEAQLSQIKSTPLSYYDRLANKLIRKHEPSGSCMEKSGYIEITRNHDSSLIPVLGSWHGLWKASVCKKVKHFVWLVLHDALSVNWFCVMRNLTYTST